MNKSKPTQPSSPPTNPEQTVSYQADAPTPKPAAAPKQIGRFVVLRMLGEGAFGQVFKARDPQLDREVAIKVPKPGVFASDQERERFLREARAAAAIQHPNVCAVHEVNADAKTLYIVMAYIAGSSLADYLRERKTPLTAKQAALIVRKLAQALHVAHQKGVVHRDLKPANILFDRERKDVVITDFGLARRERAGDADLTQAGAILGTPAYMSPEQARGDNKAIGPASDIFSLGAILYELLTGTRPFKGSIGEVIGKVQHVTPESPSTLKPGIDARLDKICAKAMAKLPKDRFGSMREFAWQLGEFLKDTPTGAIAEGTPAAKEQATGASEASQMAEIIAALSVERQAETKKLERSQRGLSRLILGVGGCLGLLLVLSICTAGGVGGWLYWRGPETPPGPAVTVTLQNITHLHDNSVHYYLNGKKIDSKKLEGPLELTLGEYKLEGKHGNEVVETRVFNVGLEDNQKEIATFQPEQDGPPGLIRTIKHTGNISGLAVSPDGRWIMAVHSGFSINNFRSGSNVGLWDLESGELLKEERILDAETVTFASDSKHAFLGFHSVPPPINAFAVKYDLRNPKQWKDVRRFETTQGLTCLTPLELSRDGSVLLMGANQSINLWTTKDAKQILCMEGAFNACLSPDGQRFYSVSGKDLIAHDIRAGKAEPIGTFKGHTAPITRVACSRDGKMVAAGAGEPTCAVRAWEISTGKMLDHFARHGSGVTSICFSPDGKRLLTTGADGVLRISDVQSGEEIHATPPRNGGINCAVYSPGGRRAVFGLDDGTIKVWRVPK